MAAKDAETRDKPVPIASAPAGTSSSNPGANGGSRQPVMPYTCQTCAKRKVKCDKATPTCSSCRKSELECFYQAPPSRRRKRKLSNDVTERLAHYERILHQHGLLPQNGDASPSIEDAFQEPISLRWSESETSRTGKLLAGQGKSRYIGSNLWRHLGEDEMHRLSDDEEEDQVGTNIIEDFASDPLTGAFLGSQKSLLHYHPAHAEAIMLWKTHIENVEPICKVVHIPSTFKMVDMISKQPAIASKAEECLLFAIYHFAVFSMAEEECAEKFRHSRATLLQRYRFATRQALVNASFLKTTEMSVIQALVLFLLPCRYFYDAHTYWILTGVAIRIAQRMGLHRDGEKMGLSPFDVQMRRRLFYQLIPLDGVASQMSGTGIAIMPDTWDTQQPLNINDDQIWPGMTETPEESNGATEMIFCLARSCVGKLFARTGKSMHGTKSQEFKNHNEVEQVISEVESEVEEKYIRYCDIVNPLHFLTMALARSAIIAMRLRIRLPKFWNQAATDAERREMFQLSQKIIDTDTTACAHINLRRYQWHVRSFWVWGLWDSLIFVVTSLWRSDLLSPVETDAEWSRVEQVYNNHEELLQSRQALLIAFGRLTLKAWDTNPPSTSVSEPGFISALRSQRGMTIKSRAERQYKQVSSLDAKTETVLPLGLPPASDMNISLGTLSGDMGLDISNDFNLDTVDWIFWDQLIRDYQGQGDQQQDKVSQ